MVLTSFTFTIRKQLVVLSSVSKVIMLALSRGSLKNYRKQHVNDRGAEGRHTTGPTLARGRSWRRLEMRVYAIRL